MDNLVSRSLFSGALETRLGCGQPRPQSAFPWRPGDEVGLWKLVEFKKEFWKLMVNDVAITKYVIHLSS